MRFFIEIVADSHEDALGLISEARKMLKRGVSGEAQFCLGGLRVYAHDECDCVQPWGKAFVASEHDPGCHKAKQ